MPKPKPKPKLKVVKSDAKKRRTVRKRAEPAPAWLSPAAKRIFRRVRDELRAEDRWLPSFEFAAARFAALEAEFQHDPGGFNAARTNTLRLLSNDLGLSPRSYGLAPSIDQRKGADHGWDDL